MIIDQLSRHPRYTPLDSGIARALEFLRTTDVAQLPDGRHEIDGDRVFAIVNRYQSKLPAEAVWESHQRHIDVQYVVDGRERIGFVPLETAPAIVTPYNAERDVVFYEPGVDTVLLSAGQFAVLYPEDIHAPGLTVDGRTPEAVLKVVVKVACR